MSLPSILGFLLDIQLSKSRKQGLYWSCFLSYDGHYMWYRLHTSHLAEESRACYRNFSKSWGISSRLSPTGIRIALEKPAGDI